MFLTTAEHLVKEQRCDGDSCLSTENLDKIAVVAGVSAQVLLTPFDWEEW